MSRVVGAGAPLKGCGQRGPGCTPGTAPAPSLGAGGSCHHAAVSRRNAAGEGEGEEEEIGFLSTLETKAALFINFHKY